MRTTLSASVSRGGAGFSVLEVMVAVAVLTVGLGAVAQSFLLARRASVAARVATLVSALAAQKMEQLTLHSGGLVVGGSVQTTVPGFSDAFDATGQALPALAPSAAFIRRWSVSTLAADPVQSRVLSVRVLRAESARPGGAPWPTQTPDETRLVTVVTDLAR